MAAGINQRALVPCATTVYLYLYWYQIARHRGAICPGQLIDVLSCRASDCPIFPGGSHLPRPAHRRAVLPCIRLPLLSRRESSAPAILTILAVPPKCSPEASVCCPETIPLKSRSVPCKGSG